MPLFGMPLYDVLRFRLNGKPIEPLKLFIRAEDRPAVESVLNRFPVERG